MNEFASVPWISTRFAHPGSLSHLNSQRTEERCECRTPPESAAVFELPFGAERCRVHVHTHTHGKLMRTQNTGATNIYREDGQIRSIFAMSVQCAVNEQNQSGARRVHHSRRTTVEHAALWNSFHWILAAHSALHIPSIAASLCHP